MALTIPKSIDPFANSLYEIQKKDSEAKAALNKATEEKRAPIEANIKNINTADIKTLEDKRAAEDKYASQSEDIAKYAEANVQKPTQFQDFKPEPLDNSKMQALGSILAAFAAIGGRHTRTSALSAGNALAGALQGYKEGNQLKFENDYKVYKTNFDKVIKQEEENNRYIKDMLNAKNMSLSAKLRRIELYATDHQLWEKKLAAEKGDLKELQTSVNKSEKAIDTATKTAFESLKITDTHYYQLAQEKHVANEEEIQRKRLDAQEKHWKDIDVAKLAKENNVHLTVAEEKATSNVITMENADSRIDELIKKGVRLPPYATLKYDEGSLVSLYAQSGAKLSMTDDQKLLLQAVQQFAEGAGHLKSGARINDNTMALMLNLYAPLSNDGNELIKQKSLSRKNDLMGGRALAGKGMELYEKLKKGEHSDLSEDNTTIQTAEDFVNSIGE